MADVVASLSAGEAVALLGETGRFYFAEAASGDGWLPRGAITA